MATIKEQFVCQRCGQCCMSVFLAMDNRPIDDDPKEFAKYYQLHHCQPMRYPTPKGDVFAIKIPLVCDWLIFDEDNNCYKCKDYEHRPVVCREYFCKRCNPDIPELRRKIKDILLEQENKS